VHLPGKPIGLQLFDLLRFSCECGSTILGLPQVKDGNNHPFVSYGVFRVWARDLDLLALK